MNEAKGSEAKGSGLETYKLIAFVSDEGLDWVHGKESASEVSRGDLSSFGKGQWQGRAV